jgi:hypothetical protein
MRNGSPRSVVLRFMLAVLFGVMSVVPVPLRALAHPAEHHAAAAPAAAQHSAERPHDHGAGGHHHGTHHAVTPPGGGSQDAPPPDGAVICQSAACCMAVTQPLPSAPASILLLLGQLAMTPARVIVAVMPDPVVPPPRLPA